MTNESRNVAQIITDAQEWAGVSDDHIANVTGYDVKVVEMIKAGRMRLPVNKVTAFARAVHMDSSTLLQAVLSEYSPDVWSAVSEILKLDEQSEMERNLIHRIRELTGSRKAAPIVIDGSAVIAIVVAQ